MIDRCTWVDYLDIDGFSRSLDGMRVLEYGACPGFDPGFGGRERTRLHWPFLAA
jgi:hypothetical protein